MLTHFSTFSGIGGIDLAAEWAGFRTIGQCELADYPHAVLCKHWPDVPKWRDIKTVDAGDVKRRTGIDSPTLLSGGFPCQPFSSAGKRRGAEDDRFLWPELFRVVRELRPTWFLGENVAGIINMALDDCISDLESEGYSCRSFNVPACGIGAWHRRERVFIVAYTEGCGCRGNVRRSPPAAGLESRHQDVSDAAKLRFSESTSPEIEEGQTDERSEPAGILQGRFEGSSIVPDTERLQWSQFGKNGRMGWERKSIAWFTRCIWESEPAVGRVANGIPRRVDRLRCLGNAVVPQQVYPFCKAIAEIESMSVKE